MICSLPSPRQWRSLPAAWGRHAELREGRFRSGSVDQKNCVVPTATDVPRRVYGNINRTKEKWLIVGCSCPANFVNRQSGTGDEISVLISQKCAESGLAVPGMCDGMVWLKGGQRRNQLVIIPI